MRPTRVPHKHAASCGEHICVVACTAGCSGAYSKVATRCATTSARASRGKSAALLMNEDILAAAVAKLYHVLPRTAPQSGPSLCAGQMLARAAHSRAHLLQQLIVPLRLQALLIQECAVGGAQVHQVRPHGRAGVLLLYQPAHQAKALTPAQRRSTRAARMLCLPCRLTPGHTRKPIITGSHPCWLLRAADTSAHRYCSTACCLLQEGWSVGTSTTRCSRPNR